MVRRGRDVIGKEMSLGELIAFLAYLAMFYAPLGALSNFTSWLTSFLSGSKRVLELMETPLGIQDPAHAKKWDNPRGHLQFDHVTFGYDRNQPVIKDVSFEVAPGEMVGIVGRSGSGKSTMVNLLGRFYDVQEGAVLVDGIDVRNLSMQSLRENLGIVFQDSFLFRGTIWKNLSYGRPQSTIEEALVAAKAAGAHDFILRQSLGYETLLGEHGAGLSGGEKQRLSIARTLLYDPKVLILDEATSNIDAEADTKYPRSTRSARKRQNHHRDCAPSLHAAQRGPYPCLRSWSANRAWYPCRASLCRWHLRKIGPHSNASLQRPERRQTALECRKSQRESRQTR